MPPLDRKVPKPAVLEPSNDTPTATTTTITAKTTPGTTPIRHKVITALLHHHFKGPLSIVQLGMRLMENTKTTKTSETTLPSETTTPEESTVPEMA